MVQTILVSYWPVVVGAFIIAFVLSLGYIVLMKRYTSFVIYVVVFIGLIILGVLLVLNIVLSFNRGWFRAAFNDGRFIFM